jgi:hypothetical protein
VSDKETSGHLAFLQSIAQPPAAVNMLLDAMLLDAATSPVNVVVNWTAAIRK